MNQTVFTKVISVLFVLLSLIVAVLVVVLDVERLHDVSWVMTFFNAMLPILAVGALLKYLSSHN